MPPGLAGLCFCFDASRNVVTELLLAGGRGEGGGGGGGEGGYGLPGFAVSPVDVVSAW